MNWQMIPLEDVAPMPRRNGSGVTRELLAWPTPQDWDWRIAVAELDKNGPLSPQPGVQRWLALLGGAGLTLTLDGTAHDLKAQGAPLCFDGALPCVCELLDGPIEDFNLMLKQGRAQAHMVRILGTLDLQVMAGTRVAVYAWDEPVAVQVDRTFATVSPHTLAWGVMADGASVHIEASSALWMEIR